MLAFFELELPHDVFELPNGCFELSKDGFEIPNDGFELPDSFLISQVIAFSPENMVLIWHLLQIWMPIGLPVTRNCRGVCGAGPVVEAAAEGSADHAAEGGGKAAAGHGHISGTDVLQSGRHGAAAGLLPRSDALQSGRHQALQSGQHQHDLCSRIHMLTRKCSFPNSLYPSLLDVAAPQSA